jgi:hypothetical protein
VVPLAKTPKSVLSSPCTVRARFIQLAHHPHRFLLAMNQHLLSAFHLFTRLTPPNHSSLLLDPFAQDYPDAVDAAIETTAQRCRFNKTRGTWAGHLIASGCSDGLVEVVDLDTKDVIRIFDGHVRGVESLRYELSVDVFCVRPNTMLTFYMMAAGHGMADTFFPHPRTGNASSGTYSSPNKTCLSCTTSHPRQTIYHHSSANGLGQHQTQTQPHQTRPFPHNHLYTLHPPCVTRSCSTHLS